MGLKIYTCVAILSLGLGVSAYADTAVSAVPSPWAGSKASLGMTFNTGNSPTSTANGELDVDYAKDVWTNDAALTFQYGKSDGVLNKQQYLVKDQLSYSFNHNKEIDNYAFVKSSFQTNLFSAFKNQLMVIAGYGRDWIKTKTFHLSTQFGPAFQKTQDQLGEVTGNVAGQVEISIAWSVTANGVLSEDATYTVSQVSNHLQSKTAFTNKIIGNLAMSLSFNLENYSKVPKDSTNKFKTDTSTSIALVYTF